MLRPEAGSAANVHGGTIRRTFESRIVSERTGTKKRRIGMRRDNPRIAVFRVVCAGAKSARPTQAELVGFSHG